MENAGSAAATAIRRLYNTEGKFITIFCGRGNNGGDGFVVARKLAEGESNVVVVLTDGQPRTEQAQEMLTRITYMEIPVIEYGNDPAYLTEDRFTGGCNLWKRVPWRAGRLPPGYMPFNEWSRRANRRVGYSQRPDR